MFDKILIAKVNVAVTDLFRYHRLIFSRQPQHLVIDVDPNYTPGLANDLRRDIADFTASGSKVQDMVAGLEMS